VTANSKIIQVEARRRNPNEARGVVKNNERGKVPYVSFLVFPNWEAKRTSTPTSDLTAMKTIF
jgi:hypothetical protein